MFYKVCRFLQNIIEHKERENTTPDSGVQHKESEEVLVNYPFKSIHYFMKEEKSMKNFLKNMKNKMLFASAAVSSAMVGGSIVSAFAEEGDYKSAVWAQVWNVLDYILWFAALAGVVWAGWGVFQMVMGFKEEDAEKKNRGTMQLVAGLLLVCLRFVLKGVFEGLLGIA